jgi:hypothetical protein
MNVAIVKIVGGIAVDTKNRGRFHDQSRQEIEPGDGPEATYQQQNYGNAPSPED